MGISIENKYSFSPPQPKPVPVHNLFVANLSFQARSKDLINFSVRKIVMLFLSRLYSEKSHEVLLVTVLFRLIPNRKLRLLSLLFKGRSNGFKLWLKLKGVNWVLNVYNIWLFPKQT